MDITIGNSLAALQRANIKREPPEGNRLQSRILAVNYVSRRIQCQASGHANLRRVRVSDNINLGTPQKPRVYPGDIAKLEKNPRNGKWECVGVIHKIKCPPGTPVDDTVEVDVAYEYSNSNITGGFGDTIVPELPFIPDVGALGQISLPSQLPQLGYLCSIPPCEDCSPDGYQDGMVPVLDASGMCWKWGFRSAPCPIYFRWQGAIWTGSPLVTRGGQGGTCVLEHYVYAVRSGYKEVFSGAITQAELKIYDLSNLSAPSLVFNDFLTAPVGKYLSDIGVAAWQNYLWISGVYTTGGTLFVPDPNPDGVIQFYDISSRDNPVLLGEVNLKIDARWTLQRHYNSVTRTFTGDPYIVAYSADGMDTAYEPHSPLQMINGLTGTVEGTYSFGETVDNPHLLTCDNVILASFVGSVRAIDVTDPTLPAFLWDDTDALNPITYLGSNFAYVKTDVTDPKVSLYTNIPAGSGKVITAADFNNPDSTYGWFVYRNCLYNVEAPAAYSFTIRSKASPTLSYTDTPTIPTIAGGDIGQNEGIDIEDGVLYICSEGLGAAAGYLNVYSNQAP